jgi:hypothetical protein
MSKSLVLPVVVLVAWSLVMWAWMVATRVPAMARAGIDPQSAKHTDRGSVKELPSEVRQVADNYNHLMEQPTIFYALALAMTVGGLASGLDVWLAWAYTGLRIAHSLWQALVNVVMVRFYLFLASSLVLVVLAVRALIALV